MTQALALSVRELGNVWPNPAVGCLIVKDNEIVGFGWTGRGGRPHAEFTALEAAGAKAKGSNAYVTLEPCAHEGKTPSCARLLAGAGVTRVIYATTDPDPRTAGKGAEFLKNQGIQVDLGLYEREALRINQGFFTRLKEGRPLITMKMALSKDGMIAEREGVRTTITGEETNLFTQKLRAKYDAILVGIGTVLADNPTLLCKIQGLEDQSPVRIILDRTLKIPAKSLLIESAKRTPLWIVTEARDIPAFLDAETTKVLRVNDIRNIKEVVELIAKNGITRLFIEGGATVNTSFYDSGLVDYIYTLTNEGLDLGPEGVPAFRNPKILRAGKIRGFERLEHNRLGQDSIDFFQRRD